MEKSLATPGEMWYTIPSNGEGGVPMPTVKAILWDLDGTLLDTLQDLTDGVNTSLTAVGYPTRSREEVRTFVGNGVPKLIERAVPAGTTSADTQRVLALFRPYYAAHSADTTVPYPGILPGLATLKQAGIPMAIVSNKLESAAEDLRQRFFADTIALAVGDIPGRPTKPAPDSTRLALERLGIAPHEALFIGDSEVDVLTARAAGVPLLAAGWGFRDKVTLLAQGATVVADTPAEAFAYIQSLL